MYKRQGLHASSALVTERSASASLPLPPAPLPLVAVLLAPQDQALALKLLAPAVVVQVSASIVTVMEVRAPHRSLFVSDRSAKAAVDSKATSEAASKPKLYFIAILPGR